MDEGYNSLDVNHLNSLAPLLNVYQGDDHTSQPGDNGFGNYPDDQQHVDSAGVLEHQYMSQNDIIAAKYGQHANAEFHTNESNVHHTSVTASNVDSFESVEDNNNINESQNYHNHISDAPGGCEFGSNEILNFLSGFSGVDAIKLFDILANIPRFDCFQCFEVINGDIAPLCEYFDLGLRFLLKILRFHNEANRVLGDQLDEEAVLQITLYVALGKLSIHSSCDTKAAHYKTQVTICPDIATFEGLFWNELLNPVAIVAKIVQLGGVPPYVIAELRVNIPPLILIASLVCDWELAVSICGNVIKVLRYKQTWYSLKVTSRTSSENFKLKWDKSYDLLSNTEPRSQPCEFKLTINNALKELNNMERLAIDDSTPSELRHARYFDCATTYIEVVKEMVKSAGGGNRRLTTQQLEPVWAEIEKTLGVNQIEDLRQCRTANSFTEWCWNNLVDEFDIAGKIFVSANPWLYPGEVHLTQYLDICTSVPFLTDDNGALFVASWRKEWARVSERIATIIKCSMQSSKDWWEPSKKIEPEWLIFLWKNILAAVEQSEDVRQQV